jgi:iron complex transport system substrate-binding protein
MKIVSLAPSATSILCEIGARRMLVGVSKWCADVAEVGGLPRFGDCWHMKDAAAIHALRPDLVIGSMPFRAEALVELLKEPVNFLALNPKTLADIERDILQLGGIAGREAGARRLVARMRREFGRVAARGGRVAKKRGVVRIYAEAWPNPRIASPVWVAELIAMAGGEMCVRAGARVSEVEVAAANPDGILLAWAATGKKAKVAQVYAVKEWAGVAAVRERRVFVVQDELVNTPGPPLVRGLKEIARIVDAYRGGGSR